MQNGGECPTWMRFRSVAGGQLILCTYFALSDRVVLCTCNTVETCANIYPKLCGRRAFASERISSDVSILKLQIANWSLVHAGK